MEQTITIYGKTYVIETEIKPEMGDDIICINKYSLKHGTIRKCEEDFDDMVNWNKLIKEIH